LREALGTSIAGVRMPAPCPARWAEISPGNRAGHRTVAGGTAGPGRALTGEIVGWRGQATACEYWERAAV